jgi:hypothetical protein
MTKLRCHATLRPLVDAATRQGWNVSLTGKAHLRFQPPDRQRPLVIASGTPHARSSVDLLIHDLRRSGFQWPA